MAGNLKRRSRSDQYTQISNETLRSNDLSWRAKGLLCYLLSHDESFEIRKKNISNYATDGYDSTNSAFKELESKGYIRTIGTGRDSKGNFIGFDYEFDEKPIFEQKNSPDDTLNPIGIYRNGQTATGRPLRASHDKEEQVSITINSNPNKNKKEEVKTSDFNNIQSSLFGDANQSNNSDNNKKYAGARENFSIQDYVDMANDILAIEGKKRSFRKSSTLEKSFKARIKDGYTRDDFEKAMRGAVANKYHIENKFMYLTTFFFVRADKIDMYKNQYESILASEEKNKTAQNESSAMDDYYSFQKTLYAQNNQL